MGGKGERESSDVEEKKLYRIGNTNKKQYRSGNGEEETLLVERWKRKSCLNWRSMRISKWRRNRGGETIKKTKCEKCKRKGRSEDSPQENIMW